MHYQTEHALSQARSNDLMPIRNLGLSDTGWYKLKAADGTVRFVAAGSANTAWANAGWPKVGKWAVAWTVGLGFSNAQN
jgi:hypothetical protein